MNFTGLAVLIGLIFGLFLSAVLFLAIFYIATGMMYVDGKFSIGLVALLCGFMMFFMVAVTCIRERIRAKEEKED